MKSCVDDIDTETLLRQTWLFALRQEIKFTGLQAKRLDRQNLNSKKQITAPGGPVISLTSFGKRIKTVHLTIEAIASGSVLPSRCILWISNEEVKDSEVPSLRRLVERGLEICVCEDLGPHKKYYPYLMSVNSFDLPLVTADDDVLYCEWWLEGLLRENQKSPNNVISYRAHRLNIDNGAVGPYISWQPCETRQSSFLNFATGASGCLYPALFLDSLKRAGSSFKDLCPKADDVWLHANAVRARFEVRQVFSRPMRFPCIPGTQAGALFETNHLSGQNDIQISNTYTAEDISVLEAAERGCS